MTEKEIRHIKKKITASWAAGCYASSILGIIPSVLYWSTVYKDEQFKVLGEIMAISLMIPVGWVFTIIMPWSWVSIGCYIWAIKSKKYKPLIGAYLASFVFGIFWPKIFWDMISV